MSVKREAYPDPRARRQPTMALRFSEKWRLWIVGMGRAMTAKSDAIFRTAWDRATFSRHLVVPDLRGLHGAPVMMHKARV